MPDLVKRDPRGLVHISSADHVPMLCLLASYKGCLPLYLPRYLLIGGGYGSWVTERNVQPWLQCVRNPGDTFEMGLAGMVIGVVPSYDLEGDDDGSPNLTHKFKYQVIIDGALGLVDDLFIHNVYIREEEAALIPYQKDYGVSLVEWAHSKREVCKRWFGE